MQSENSIGYNVNSWFSHFYIFKLENARKHQLISWWTFTWAECHMVHLVHNEHTHTQTRVDSCLCQCNIKIFFFFQFGRDLFLGVCSWLSSGQLLTAHSRGLKPYLSAHHSCISSQEVKAHCSLRGNTHTQRSTTAAHKFSQMKLWLKFSMNTFFETCMFSQNNILLFEMIRRGGFMPLKFKTLNVASHKAVKDSWSWNTFGDTSERFVISTLDGVWFNFFEIEAWS